MPDLTVAPVHSRRDRAAFIDLPFRLYEHDPLWVPPLRSEEWKAFDPRHQPFFQHADSLLFLARRGGKPVGRIAAILDRNAPPGNGGLTGSFGYFESVDDAGVARALLDSAGGWLRSHGAALMFGPLCPSINYASGLLVDGFDDPPYLGLLYNPPFYDRLLTSAGLEPAKDFLALKLRLDDLRTPKALRFAQFARCQPGVTFRSVDTTRPEEEGRLIWNLYSSAWAANWGFAPASLAEFQKIGADLLQFADPRLIQFCEVNGRPVGLLCVVPDLNQALMRARGRLLPFGWWHMVRARTTATRARIMLIGMLPEWQRKGLAAGFIPIASLPGTERYADLEASWILEDNLRAIRGIEWLGARVYKRYRMYRTALG